MSKFHYIAYNRFPTEKAHGIQIAKTCEALAEAGAEVTLLVPKRANAIASDPFEYYKINRTFAIKYVPTIVPMSWGKAGYVLGQIGFGIVAALWSRKVQHVYSRDVLPAILASFFNRNTWWETHDGKEGFLVQVLLRHAKGVVAISNGLKKYYVERYKVPSQKIAVVRDAADMRADMTLSKEEARRKLGLPVNERIAVYAGHLYDWKGARVLAEAAHHLSSGTVVFVGGTEHDVARFKKDHHSSRSKIEGWKPHETIPTYLRAADVLILPNSGKYAISKLYTSPMKLFEYMASGVPIVASKLPSIEEVLSDKNAVLVEADNPQALSQAIELIFEAPSVAEERALRAKEDVKMYSWKNRAHAILTFIQL